jgi:adenylyltransferase/sulfurtransferase
MKPTSIDSRTSIELFGTAIAGATDRQERIAGFNQSRLSEASVLAIGAGGLVGPVAMALARKGAGAITIFDPDVVEASNLNRQRFFLGDIGRNKAIALVENLAPECIARTQLRGERTSFEDALALRHDMSCDVAICGVDNNPARVSASRYFRGMGVPVVFMAVSADADHGYVFVQDRAGPCLGCIFPEIASDDRYPCPGTPAVLDVLQAVAALAVYAIDTCLMHRVRHWNYRSIRLSDGTLDGSGQMPIRPGCALVSTH